MTQDCDDQRMSRKREISLKLTITARQLGRGFDQSVASIGVTRSQWTLIAVIKRYPGATQREIAEILETSEASAGRSIDRLCADGLLVRRPKDDDRRAYCVFLTEAADPILDIISGVATKYEGRLFEGFEPEDLDKLEAYLDLLAANTADMR